MKLKAKVHQTHEKMEEYEFVSWVTVSGIALIRKSLYFSRIF